MTDLVNQVQDRFRHLADSAPDMLFRWSMAAAAFEYVNPASEAVVGHAADDLLARPELVEQILGQDTLLALLDRDWSSARAHTVELEIQRGDGTAGWVELRLTVHEEGGRIVGVDGIVRDLAERRAAEEELRRRAFYDSLTGLANRALLYERLEHALRSADPRRGSPVVLLIDLDGFKGVNDRFGHAAGDRLLVTVAGRLSASVRGEDTVARLGGDEFLVLCEDVADDAEIELIRARLGGAIAAPIELAGTTVQIGASIGAVRADGLTDADAIVHRADVAMYERKRGARRVATATRRGGGPARRGGRRS